MESRGPTSAPSNQKKRNPHALELRFVWQSGLFQAYFYSSLVALEPPTSDIEIVNTDINSQN